ncbi:YiiD C-terminal domain-containing protein [Marinobacterium mangrovicola]|uniref:Thioesterase domain-containing protein n=1 Tax=Marinobacterium mangrovicola TaxID=1476959 RepID=A0A4R1GQ03_9GAMM|nr:YiiD C-terminal domain-containing protein [Marinobacterium mangrovicola]TCK08119.1 thioesterase domain-containing protein [Marinobacterium mangrovicola]
MADTGASLTTDPAQFLSWLYRSIPLTSAMQIERLEFDGQVLELHVPLAPNVNDKGTGFGGSISALATLAGWCLTTLYLRGKGLDCDVVIADAHQSYKAPIKDAFFARVRLSSKEDCDHLLNRIDERGRGRLDLKIDVLCDDQAGKDEVAFVMQGRYVAIQR